MAAEANPESFETNSLRRKMAKELEMPLDLN